MDHAKEQRLRHERFELWFGRLTVMREAVLSFRREFGCMTFPQFPRDRDFAALPEVEQIVTRPPEASITVDSFSHLSAIVPDFLVSWEQKRLDDLEAFVRKDMDLPDGVRATDLAVTQFHKCGMCYAPLDLRQMISHSCGEYQYYWEQRTEYEEASDRATGSCLEVRYRQGTPIIRKLLEACGQDYRTVTAHEMDELDPMFHCRVCDLGIGDVENYREVFSWRTGVRPFYSDVVS